MSPKPQIVVIGGGIAGISAAAYMSLRAQVTVVDMESTLTYHTTGRSAAVYFRSYGSAQTLALTAASEHFFASEGEGHADGPLMSERGLVIVAREDQLSGLKQWWGGAEDSGPDVLWLDGPGVERAVPTVRPGYAAGGVFEPSARDLDVAAIHQTFVRLLRSRHGEILTAHPVSAIVPSDHGWLVEAGDRHLTADVVVNAAGAWGDVIAGLAGVQPVGLTPLRRTAFMVAGAHHFAGIPMLVDADEEWYAKPDGAQFLCSPGDETPSPPCDARPEETDIALAIERINRATTLNIRSVRSQWAGLRTFAPDRVPVTGFDPDHEGFFWLVGQGGSGIQTAPAAGRFAAAMALDRQPPPDLIDWGLDVTSFDPARFRQTA